MLYFFKKLTICFYIKNNKFIINMINIHFNFKNELLNYNY